MGALPSDPGLCVFKGKGLLVAQHWICSSGMMDSAGAYQMSQLLGPLFGAGDKEKV